MARTPKVVEDRREQILDAAIHVFSQKGFSEATNKDIAREAGITTGLIYHYFTNKRAILDEIIQRRSPLNLVRTLPPSVLELSPEPFFRYIIPQVLRIVEEEKFVRLIRVFLPEALRHPEMAQLGTGALQEVLGFLSRYFASKMEQGELRPMDPSLAAQTLLGSVVGFVLRRQILHDQTALRYSHEEIASVVIDMVLQGMLPR